MNKVNFGNFVNLFLIVLLFFCCYNIIKVTNSYETRIQTLENKIDKVKVSELQQILDNHKKLVKIAETNRDYIYSCVDDINLNTETIKTILDTNEIIMKLLKE